MKIACVAHRLDYVLSKAHRDRRELYYVLFEGLNDSQFLSSLLPRKKILWCRLKKQVSIQEKSDEWLIKNSDLTRILKQTGITHFVLSHQGDTFLDKWAKKAKLSLVGPTYGLTKTLENKGWFQRFLHTNKIPSPPSIICTGKELSRIKNLFPCVIQELESFGSFGTFFDVSKARLNALLKNGVLKQTQSYLVRKLIRGNTYGISLVIGPKCSSLSALRLQCFHEKSARNIIFAGIQWIPTIQLGKRLINRIEKIFTAIDINLRASGILGLFNFDIIVDDDNKVFVLECNPRLSSATSQIQQNPSLIGKNFSADSMFFLDFPTGKSKKLTIPASKFSGALLDIVPNNPAIIKNDDFCGTYSFSSNFKKSSIIRTRASKAQRGGILVHGSVACKSYVDSGSTLASIISDCPLFTREGKLSDEGRHLHSTVLRLIC